ncbi:hypothetical protein [Pedobacter aquatilis]|uniref:hypothetical protein n=1 Tax=Pedobacter aquatilis TaxID=351343 RepID=UPI0029309047|nr:hypothetical protein [Pedobacter aquatilis]
MEKLDFATLGKQMLDALKGSFKKDWAEVKPYAEKETRAFAENLKLIALLKLEGKIDEERARLHIDIQKNSMRIVFLTIEGLGILAVENAINAAIDVVRNTVNTALGWAIL